MSQLHNIDRPEGKYTELELDEMMVFCILDTAISYEKCCEAFDALKKDGLTTRRALSLSSPDSVKNILKSVGYRWANQKAKYLTEFGRNNIDLMSATRKEIVGNVKGVGMKLASMFLRNTRGEKYAVLDRHTLRYVDIMAMKILRKHGPLKTYEEKEKFFIELAEAQGKTVAELDMEIWQRERVGNK